MVLRLQLTVLALAVVFSFMLGFSVSARTTNEPGYFEAVETAAYGVTKKTQAIGGLTPEEQEYYRNLAED